eukprot:3149724-Pleurochrysis_carterae.AAC.3
MCPPRARVSLLPPRTRALYLSRARVQVLLCDPLSGAATHRLSGHRADAWVVCWSPVRHGAQRHTHGHACAHTFSIQVLRSSYLSRRNSVYVPIPVFASFETETRRRL